MRFHFSLLFGNSFKNSPGFYNLLQYIYSQVELFMVIAMQDDVCKNGVDLKQIVAVANNILEDDVDAQFGDLASALSKFNVDELDSIKNDLIKYFGPEVVEFAMIVLRDLQNGSGRGINTSDALNMVSCERNNFIIFSFTFYLIICIVSFIK